MEVEKAAPGLAEAEAEADMREGVHHGSERRSGPSSVSLRLTGLCLVIRHVQAYYAR